MLNVSVSPDGHPNVHLLQIVAARFRGSKQYPGIPLECSFRERERKPMQGMREFRRNPLEAPRIVKLGEEMRLCAVIAVLRTSQDKFTTPVREEKDHHDAVIR